MGKAGDTASSLDTRRDLTEDAILDYLLRHPDFLMDHPEVLVTATAPQRFAQSEDRVVDIQHVMLRRLQTEMADLQDCAEQLIMTTRSNMATQKGTLKAALAVLESEGLGPLMRTVTEDLPLILDVDVCALRLEHPGRMPSASTGDEAGDGPASALASALGGEVTWDAWESEASTPEGEARRAATLDLAWGGLLTDPQTTPGAGLDLCILPPGFVAAFFPAGRQALLRPQIQAEPVIYGDLAGLVRSDALVRLDPGAGLPPGLLALGTRLDGTFEPDMAMDLLVFLARVVEVCVRRWAPVRP